MSREDGILEGTQKIYGARKMFAAVRSSFFFAFVLFSLIGIGEGIGKILCLNSMFRDGEFAELVDGLG